MASDDLNIVCVGVVLMPVDQLLNNRKIDRRGLDEGTEVEVMLPLSTIES